MSNEWQEWATQAKTREFRDKLLENRQEILEAWAMGKFTHATVDGTAQRNAEHLGKAECYRAMAEMLEEWMKGETA